MRSLTHLDIGQIGEEATLKHYLRLGYELVKMNYWKPFGEIDVIVRVEEELVFAEVKSVSCKTFSVVSRDTANPVDNVHYQKRKRLRKTITAFLSEEGLSASSWRFDIAVVRVNTEERRSRVEIIEDVIL